MMLHGRIISYLLQNGCMSSFMALGGLGSAVRPMHRLFLYVDALGSVSACSSARRRTQKVQAALQNRPGPSRGFLHPHFGAYVSTWGLLCSSFFGCDLSSYWGL